MNDLFWIRKMATALAKAFFSAKRPLPRARDDARALIAEAIASVDDASWLADSGDKVTAIAEAMATFDAECEDLAQEQLRHIHRLLTVAASNINEAMALRSGSVQTNQPDWPVTAAHVFDSGRLANAYLRIDLDV